MTSSIPSTSTLGHAAGMRPAAAAAANGRLVVDAPIRMFHALFALCFVGAYLTADSEHWRALHVTLGYTFAGLLVFRLLYGLFGPRQARLGLMWRRAAGAPAWLRSLWPGGAAPAKVHWAQGLNLLVALAPLAMLTLVVPLALSGYATYAEWGDVFGGDAFEELHEFFGNLFLMVALLHLALVALTSLVRRKNQALPMLTGRIDGPGPDLVKHPQTALAALLLLGVLGFGAWQWQQAPDGLLPGAARAGHSERDHDDD